MFQHQLLYQCPLPSTSIASFPPTPPQLPLWLLFSIPHCPSVPLLTYHPFPNGKLPAEDQFSCSWFLLLLGNWYSLTKFLYIPHVKKDHSESVPLPLADFTQPGYSPDPSAMQQIAWLFFLLTEWYFIVFIYHSFFSHGHLGRFHIFAVVYSTAMNIGVQMSSLHGAFGPLGYRNLQLFFSFFSFIFH